jgi:hypothetical protein
MVDGKVSFGQLPLSVKVMTVVFYVTWVAYVIIIFSRLYN